MLSSSISVGGTKVPCAQPSGSGSCSTLRPFSRIVAMCASMPRFASASITGPTSIDRRSGLPTASSRIAPVSISSVRSATSSCRHRTRSAEHRWPAESKDDCSTSATTCSASADESTIIAFWPPVSAISGIGLPSGSRRLDSVLLMRRATSVEPVNITRARARIGHQRGADRFAVARQQLHRARRHAGFAQNAHGLRGDQRRLFGRLREHRVAGSERRGDLADENRQREIPRADTDHRTERAMRVVGELVANLRGVVAQEVDRLADLRDRVRPATCRLRARPDPSAYASALRADRRRARGNRRALRPAWPARSARRRRRAPARRSHAPASLRRPCRRGRDDRPDCARRARRRTAISLSSSIGAARHG